MKLFRKLCSQCISVIDTRHKICRQMMLFQFLLSCPHRSLRSLPVPDCAHPSSFLSICLEEDFHACRTCKNASTDKLSRLFKCLDTVCSDLPQGSIQIDGSSSTSAPFPEAGLQFWKYAAFGLVTRTFQPASGNFSYHAKFICQRAHLSHHNNGRCLNPLSVQLRSFQSTDRRHHPLLSRSCSLLTELLQAYPVPYLPFRSPLQISSSAAIPIRNTSVPFVWVPVP